MAVAWQWPRAYNLTLMRFHSPDSFSPFAIGGRNAYLYCHGDPINSTDPSGRFAIPLMLGLTGIVGGAVPLITSSQPGSGGDDGGISPWMIGMIVVGVAALGVGVLGAGRYAAQGNSQGIKPLLLTTSMECCRRNRMSITKHTRCNTRE